MQPTDPLPPYEHPAAGALPPATHQAPRRRRSLGGLGGAGATVALSAGLVAGGVVGGYIVSHAATATPSPTASPSSPGSNDAGDGRHAGSPLPANYPGGRDEDQQVIAGAIGITVTQLATEEQAGKSVAQVAQAHSVAPQKVIDALVASEQKEIAAALAAGTITQAQADQLRTTVVDRATREVNDTDHGGPGGPRGGGPGGDASDRQTVATAIGITVAQLDTEAHAGGTIAAIAKAHNVDPATVVSALVAAETKDIDAELAAGHITQAQATQAKAALQQRVTDEVNATGRGPGPGDHDQGGPRGGPGDPGPPPGA